MNLNQQISENTKINNNNQSIVIGNANKMLINSDIVVFGAQELGLETDAFEKMLLKLMGLKYVTIKVKRLKGLFIAMFAKIKLAKKIHSIHSEATRTGLGNIYGNKGAVGISCKIDRTSFCFVNAHLAALRSSTKLQKRIEDIVLIIQGLGLGMYSINVHFTFYFSVNANWMCCVVLFCFLFCCLNLELQCQVCDVFFFFLHTCDE